MKKKIILAILFIIVLVSSILFFIYKNKIIIYLQRHDIIAYNYSVNAEQIPILTFHSVVTDQEYDKYYKDNLAYVKESFFEEIMKYLHDNNYKTLSMDEFYEWYKGNKEYDKKTVVITFDDGRLDNYFYAAPILKKYNIHATIFVVGSFIKEKSDEYTEGKIKFMGQDLIDDMKVNYPNIELQSHTYELHKQDKKGHAKVDNYTKEELVSDFKKMRELYNYDYIAYPFGKFNELVLDAAKEAGYKLGFAYKPYDYARRSDNAFAIKRIKVKGSYKLYDVKRILMY